MRLGRCQFKPGLVPTLSVLLLFPLLIALGVWQLNRAETKYRLRALHELRSAKPPIQLKASMDHAGDLLGRKVNVRGKFDLSHQVLLDNQTYRNVPGYYVYSPFRIQGSNVVVLVNRGWIAQGRSREQLPALPDPGVQRTLHGVVGNPPSVGLKLGGLGEGYPGWPKVLQYLDYGWYAKRLGSAVLPYTIYQEGGADNGLIRHWPAAVLMSQAMPPEKHMSYAVQWFALAFVLLAIYVSVNLHKVGDVQEVKA